MGDPQLLKGILEGCVLSVIARGETYGYEILSAFETSGFGPLLEGTLYPVLTRLEKKGAITCRKEKSPFGPMRKYYRITTQGQEELAAFKDNYRQIVTAANAILEEEEEKP